MARLTAIVVEDQPLSREHIAGMLRALDIDVIATCANGREAIEQIPALSPDVVFLDVQMPLLNGFEVIEAIGADAMPPVVFITAYDAYALKAFDVFASGYLLKPVGAARLAEVVNRVEAQVLTKARRTRDLLQLLAQPRSVPATERLVVRTEGRVVFVSPADVEWIEACGNYAVIHAGGARHITRQPLHTLQRRLALTFSRVHRSALINLRYVASLKLAPHGECDVILRSGRTLRVTRRFRPQLEQQLRELP